MVFAENLSPSQRKRLEKKAQRDYERAAFERQVVEAYTSGKSFTKIGAETHYSPNAIRYILKKNNVELRPPSRRVMNPSERFKPEQIAYICSSYHNGTESLDTLAAQYHSSRQLIKRVLTEYGLDINPPHRRKKVK